MKNYEELDITDNFMFCKVFSNEEIAKDFLQDVLKISIEKLTVVSEATAQEDPFHKSVRLDVLAKEETADASGNLQAGRYFDIEMQMVDTGDLPKRARYYQGMCDLDVLAKGVTYSKLQEQYILFICPDDVFGKGKPVYRFQNRENSDPGILLGDLCYKNFYIFSKYSEVKDETTREYMQYFATKKCKSAKMKRIHNLVKWYRQDPATKKAYMTLEQELNIRYEKGVADGRKKGREEGRKEGREEGREEGINTRNKELAKAFRDRGVDIDVIVSSTGLTTEEIKAL